MRMHKGCKDFPVGSGWQILPWSCLLLLPQQEETFMGHRRKPQPSLSFPAVSLVQDMLVKITLSHPVHILLQNYGISAHLKHFPPWWCHLSQTPAAANYRSYCLLGVLIKKDFMWFRLASYWFYCMFLNCLTAWHSQGKVGPVHQKTGYHKSSVSQPKVPLATWVQLRSSCQ